MSYYTLKNGEKLFYEDVGSGPETLIMLHGWTSSHEIYEETVSRLKNRARCIIYDHRGHGGSKDANHEKTTMETLASDLSEIIQGLSLSNITLLGWSMGAGVILNYVRIFGCDALKQIILCDMTPKQMNDDGWKLGLYQGAYTQADMVRDAGKDFFSLYKEFAVGAVPKLKKVPGFLLDRPLKKKLAECDETVLKSLSTSMKAQDNRETGGMITVPLTYFYADPGSLFSPELANWYRDHVNTPFRAVCFPGSDHMLVSNDPDRFIENVGKILFGDFGKCGSQQDFSGSSMEEAPMTLLEAIDARHSVRAFKTNPIPDEIRGRLDAFVKDCNKEGNLNITIRYNDPTGFDSKLAHYGSFRNVQNYIVLAGVKNDSFDYRCGYYGEKIVLFAQQLGLNTCWAALTFNKKMVKEIIPDGEALCMVIALGYGETQGNSRRSKSIQDVVISKGEMPDWFRNGVEAALKAPTAVNQQKFAFGMKNGEPAVKVKGVGVYTKVDLGIVAYHFEAGSGRKIAVL